MTISTHAKERAFERYGVRFSSRRWESFERTIDNPKFAIRLQGERLACYFEKQWFLVIRKENGAVLTFLAPEDLSDEERRLLRHDERYLRANRDTFRALERNSTSGPEPRTVCPAKRPIGLPTTLTEKELPPEMLDSAENLMNKLCKRSSQSSKRLS